MARIARPLEVSDSEREELESWLRRQRMPAAEQSRARIILLSTEGLAGRVVRDRVGVTSKTVNKWRNRFKARWVAGLTDAPRTGRPRTINYQKVIDLINKTLREKPKNATYWSTNLMAKEAGLSAMSVSRICRAFGLKPHRHDTF